MIFPTNSDELDKVLSTMKNNGADQSELQVVADEYMRRKKLNAAKIAEQEIENNKMQERSTSAAPQEYQKGLDMIKRIEGEGPLDVAKSIGDVAASGVSAIGSGLRESAAPIQSAFTWIANKLGANISEEDTKKLAEEWRASEYKPSTPAGESTAAIGKPLGYATGEASKLITAGTAGGLAGSVAGKVLPQASKLATVAKGAVEGATAATAMGALEGEAPSKDTAILGATVGAALPVTGIAGKYAKQLFGKYLPESLVKSATKLTKGQKEKVAQKLSQMGDDITPETAEQYLIQNKIIGSPSQMADDLLQRSKMARQAKLDAIAGVTGKYKDESISKFANTLKKQIKGVPGLETINSKVDDVISAINSDGATLSQIDDLKTTFDNFLGKKIYGANGSVKDMATAQGLANLRSDVKTFVENAASKAGVTNIKQLNQDVAIGRMLGDMIKSGEFGGGNSLARLSDFVVAGSFGGLTGGGDWQTVLRNAGIGLIGGKILLNPTMRAKIANVLSSSLNAGEAGELLNVLKGTSKTMSPETASAIRSAISSIPELLENRSNKK